MSATVGKLPADFLQLTYAYSSLLHILLGPTVSSRSYNLRVTVTCYRITFHIHSHTFHRVFTHFSRPAMY